MVAAATVVDHDSKGRLTSAYIYVNCQDAECGTFACREAIALNRDYTVDIAEWADERDAMPILVALDAWVDEVKDELFWQRMHATKGGGGDA